MSNTKQASQSGGDSQVLVAKRQKKRYKHVPIPQRSHRTAGEETLGKKSDSTIPDQSGDNVKHN